MTIHETIDEAGIATVVMDSPPVNALTIADTYRLAEIFNSYKHDDRVKVAILTAEGRGFNAGVDIKEMQELPGQEGALQTGDACYEAFGAVYDCAVPVIAAVQDFCLGLGIGLAGNCDLVVAAAGVKFAMPEVDNGALGAATHTARLVPEKVMRHMVYTCEPVTAEQLESWGSVWQVVPAERLMDTARELAGTIASKSGPVIRKAKWSLNGIDPVDVHRSYRFEQGFTYELNLMGEGDKARAAFLAGERDSNRAAE
jgi:enoyl-CoA hydratase